MPWVSTNEAASLCEISERTVYRRAASGQLASRTDDNGKLLIEVDGTHRAPGRQLSEVSTALTAQLRITTDQYAAMIDTLTTVGTRTERRLAVVEQAARKNARTAILMAVAAVACLTGGGVGWNVLTDRHRDTLDAAEVASRAETAALTAGHADVVLDLNTRVAHARDTAEAAHSREITDLTNNHQDVVLTLERRAARSEGERDNLFSQANKLAADKDNLVSQLTKLAAEKDDLLRQRKKLAAEARGETPDGVPIMLAAQPE